MAYDLKELENTCLNVIEENKLMFINEIFAFTPFCEATFFNHNLQDLESIKNLLNKNRISTKLKLKKRWEESDNPTLQIGLYKLIGSIDEVHRLSGTRQEVDQSTKITGITLDDNELIDRIAKYKKLIEQAEKGT